MLVTTTTSLEGKRVTKYLGVVTGETVINCVGSSLSGLERELREAREMALRQMQEEAQKLGANAVLAVDIDYEAVNDGTMLIVTASGTATIVRDVRRPHI